ncbi:hypothetical protein HanIR_Chr04g0179501 [Helianthus annuus]|nr:hypothetical protein HanIR_Chr04g0179501 [Helianthus annuus]
MLLGQAFNLLRPSFLLLSKAAYLLSHRRHRRLHLIFLLGKVFILSHPLAKTSNPLRKHSCKVASTKNHPGQHHIIIHLGDSLVNRKRSNMT